MRADEYIMSMSHILVKSLNKKTGLHRLHKYVIVISGQKHVIILVLIRIIP